MELESMFRFERDNAKALLAAERDQKKRKALAERVSHYERELQRVAKQERANDE